MTRRRAFVPAIAGMVLVGCSEGPGFLDPDVVHDLARAYGTAEGFALSGQYLARADPVDCGCEGMLGSGLSVCGTLPAGASVPLTVVQSDGAILLRVATDAFTGPVDDDGTFAAGALVNIESGGLGLRLVARMDGTFGDPDRVPVALEGELWWRVEGEMLDADGEPARVDCTEHLQVTALRS